MKNQVDQINTMSKTLERSGLTEGQPTAIIETVALAMETFGVTPEILDDRLDKVMDFVREQIAEVKAEGKEQVGDVKAQGKQQFEIIMAQIKTWGDNMKSLQQSVDGLKEGMLDHQRSLFRIMMTFMVALLVAVLALFGVLVQQLLPP